MTGKLYTSYFAKISKGEGIKISIARFNPTWLTIGVQYDKWFPNLAPRPELLSNYKKGLSWDEYKDIFFMELMNDDSLDELMEIKNMLLSGKDVTLYCYEKDSSMCHRSIIKSILKRNIPDLICEEI